MRALVVNDWVKSLDELKISDFPNPTVTDYTVVVDIRAIGTNFFDGLMVQGKYQFKPSFPFIPGAEFAGVVSQVGQHVTEYKVGDRVFGGGLTGAYAEQILVSPVQLFPIPQGMSFEEAPGIYGTYTTSYAALKVRAQLKAGETCLVHAAAGGVGIAAVQVSFFDFFSSSSFCFEGNLPFFKSGECGAQMI